MDDVTQVQPTSLNHFVGNSAVVRQVQVLLDACHQDAIRFPHSAFLGPPGLGKTTLAAIVACEMGTTLHECLGQNVKRIADLVAMLIQVGDRDILHVDEAHELPREMITLLLRYLEGGRLFMAGDGSSLPLNNFTVIFSTTDEFKLPQPLIARTRQFFLEFYEQKDLERILAMRANSLGWEYDQSILPKIASRSRNTARKALALLQSVRRVCRAAGENRMTVSHVEKATTLEGLDKHGLTKRDRDYLRLLLKGPAKVNVLASKLGLHAATLTTHLEPPLLRLGWLDKTETGRRELTAKARRHLKEFGNE